MSENISNSSKKLDLTQICDQRVGSEEDIITGNIDAILQRAVRQLQIQHKNEKAWKEDQRKVRLITGEENKIDLGYRMSTDSNEAKSLTLERCSLIQGCDTIDKYEKLNYIHEGVHGAVFRAKDKSDGSIYAIKKFKLFKEKEGFPITSIREINLLLTMKHSNVVGIKEIVVGDSPEHVFVVMEFMEHELKSIMEHTQRPFSIPEIKSLMYQLLQGVEYMHDHNIMHRDLKTSNILYNNQGLLKVCDFGLARKFLGSKKSYTPIVTTLWYRAPEILLGDDHYTPAIDMWSVGCIFAELVLNEPMMRAQTEVEMIDVIFRILGNPNSSTWPRWRELKHAKNLQLKNHNVSKLSEIFVDKNLAKKSILNHHGLDLLSRMLCYDPSKRITSTEALNHSWFQEDPYPQSFDMMPKFPSFSESSRGTRRQDW